MNVGSKWQRWDVHIHTPGTALSDSFPADSWPAYIDKINRATPEVVALGVTDYFSIRGYKALREKWMAKLLPKVQFIFPNIEFRISPPTEKHKGVNIHILVDPSDISHIERIEGALTRLNFQYKREVFNCDYLGLIRFGKAFDPQIKDNETAYRVGVKEFKIDFSVFKKWYDEDPWLKSNSLIAATNGDHDGVAGLPTDHGYAAILEEMYRFSDIIFSGKPNDCKYWLGRNADTEEVLTARFGGIKPCLHGSDAHNLDRVLAPDNNRYCWIRAEPTFEGLRQVVIEPEERVYVGQDRPTRSRNNWIRSISVRGTDWFPSYNIELNEGIVAVIGPRGSGKTALADLIAFGADSFDNSPASFLTKAKREAEGTYIESEWANKSIAEKRRIWDRPSDAPLVRYLSQNFVEQLCSGDGTSERLREEIESVIFDSIDETDRLGASSFEELREIVTEGSIRRVQELRSDISLCSEEIARESASKADLPTKRERQKTINSDLLEIDKSLTGLIVKGKEEKLKGLQKIRDESAVLETKISGLKAKEQKLNELKFDSEQKKRANTELHSRIKPELVSLGISEKETEAFRIDFSGNVFEIIGRRLKEIQAEIFLLAEGSIPLIEGERHLKYLRSEIERLQKEIGGDTAKERQFVDLSKRQKAKQQEKSKLQAEIERGEQSDDIIREAQQRRIALYLELFSELSRQKQALQKLYNPLEESLAATKSEKSKLSFFVKLSVNVEEWAEGGEQLLDLRRKNNFQERGSLVKKAEELLGDAWRNGDAEKISNGMSALLEYFKDASKLLVPTATLANFADWIFSTNHIRVTYGIKYEGTEIERLSPGTRGIVLLILYLAIDTHDDRPLIVDQPEENLDPQSIFNVLTGYFREARKRRQVIIVTHNPNLVVNTDSDQVIIAASERHLGGTLPRFSYSSGGLEDKIIRTRVCEILEGGKAAFLQRERRYGLRS